MKLQTLVKKRINQRQIDNKYKVYIFGSYIKDEVNANDIDLLIVYNKHYISVTDILNERKYLSKLIHDELHLDSDICILTEEEYNYDDMMKNTRKIEI